MSAPNTETSLFAANNRFRTIDVLRGISAVAVAVFHFNEQHPVLLDPYHRAVKLGWLGVTIFFVLSGYCIAASKAKDAIIRFFAKRLVRIYPPYWASLLVVLVVVAFRVFVSGINDVTVLPRGAMAWIFTGLALSQPASSVQAINWVYWSLAYEVAFYVIMGLAFHSKHQWLIVLFSCVALAVSKFGYPFDQWGLFGLGVSCFLWTGYYKRIAPLLTLVCVVHIRFALGLTETLVAVSTALMILFPNLLGLWKLYEIFGRIGKLSYSLYLIHVPIGCYLISGLMGSRWEGALGWEIFRDFVLLSLCLLFSFWFYRVVEKPTHEFARHIDI